MLFSVASGMSDEIYADIHGVYEVSRLGIFGVRCINIFQTLLYRVTSDT